MRLQLAAMQWWYHNFWAAQSVFFRFSYRLSEKLSLGVNDIIQEYDGHDKKFGLGLYKKKNSE